MGVTDPDLVDAGAQEPAVRSKIDDMLRAAGAELRTKDSLGVGTRSADPIGAEEAFKTEIPVGRVDRGWRVDAAPDAGRIPPTQRGRRQYLWLIVATLGVAVLTAIYLARRPQGAVQSSLQQRAAVWPSQDE